VEPRGRPAVLRSARRAIISIVALRQPCIPPLKAARERYECMSAVSLERVRPGLLLDGDPLPLGELLPVRWPADARAVAGRAVPPERNMRLVRTGLVVDVQQPGAQAVADRHRAADRGGEDTGRETILVVVRKRDRLVIVAERDHRSDRTEDFL